MVSCDFEFIVDAPAAPLWAAIMDINKLQGMPALLPETHKSIEHIEGVDGEAGAVRLIKFGPALPPGSYVKEKILSVDNAQKSALVEEIEGGHLAVGCTKWLVKLKLTEEGDKKTKFTFHIDAEGEDSAVKAAFEQVKQGSPHIFSVLGKHVVDVGLTA